MKSKTKAILGGCTSAILGALNLLLSPNITNAESIFSQAMIINGASLVFAGGVMDFEESVFNYGVITDEA